MGASNSTLTVEQLKEYQDLTFFTKKEILHVYKRFVENAGKENDATFTVTDAVPVKIVRHMEELSVSNLLFLSDLMPCEISTLASSWNSVPKC